MKEERDNLRALLNSTIPENIDLGMLLMQTVGVPTGVRWNSWHLKEMGAWLSSLPNGNLTGADIEDKTICWNQRNRSYKICFYENDLRIRELHLIGGTTYTTWAGVLPLLYDIQGATFILSLDYKIYNHLFEFKKLRNLKVEDVYLTHYASKISQLVEIENLSLQRCLLEYLPQDISNLENLEVLDLRKNKLRIIPSNFWALKRLKILYLGVVKLWTMPSHQTALESLEELELENTYNIPDWVWQRMPNLKKLVWIQAHGKTIIDLNESIGALKKLQQLSLRIKVRSYPNAIGQFVQLESLEIYNDSMVIIPTLPIEWCQLVYLKTLKLRGYIQDLPMEWSNLKNLEHFSFNSKLETVPQVLYELKNLRFIRLFINKKGAIDEKIATLVHLKRIELSFKKNLQERQPNVLQQKIKLHRWLPTVDVRY